MIPIIETGLQLISKIIPDKKAQAEAKLKLLDLQQSGELTKLSEKTKVITAEIQSESILARNWRPCLMFTFMFILANNYILFPYLSLFGVKATILQIPEKMWSLLELGVSGYVVGRTVEKGIQTWKK